MIPQSIIPSDSIKIVAEVLGITRIDDDVANSLASDFEYRLREVLKEAINIEKHSKREILKTEDINTALRLYNYEPLCGYAFKDPLEFIRATTHRDLFFLDDPDLAVPQDILSSPLPPIPQEVGLQTDWLSINGEDEEPLSLPRKKSSEGTGQTKSAQEYLSFVKDVISRAGNNSSDSHREQKNFQDLLVSISQDSQVQIVAPSIIQFISATMKKNLHNLKMLHLLITLTEKLVKNPNIQIDTHAHELSILVLTCVVGKKLCENPATEDHWALRSQSAKLIACVFQKYGNYADVQPRIAKTLIHAFFDPTKPFPVHYGAVQGLISLGIDYVQLIIVPHLAAYIKLLDSKKWTNSSSLAKQESAKCRNLLLNLAGNYLNLVASYFLSLARMSPKPQQPNQQPKFTNIKSLPDLADLALHPQTPFCQVLAFNELSEIERRFNEFKEVFGDQLNPFLKKNISFFEPVDPEVSANKVE